MRTIALYKPYHFFLSTMSFDSLQARVNGSKFTYIDIDDKLAEFIRSLYNVPESKYTWDKIVL